MMPGKAVGVDIISVEILKKYVDNINKITTFFILVNLSSSAGSVPQSLKRANVIPIHNGEQLSISNNYRPILLLSVISKILETYMNTRLASFPSNTNLWFNRQYGFRKYSSTQTATTDQVTSIKCRWFAGSKKDIRNHDLLLEVSEAAGVCGSPSKWFSDYLVGRTKNVHLIEKDLTLVEKWLIYQK